MPPAGTTPRFTHNPMLWIAICFAFGILGASYFPSHFGAAAALCAVSAVLALAFVNKNISLIFVSIAFAAAGALNFEVLNTGVAENRLKRVFDESRIASGEPMEIEGVLLRRPEPLFDGLIFKVKAEKIIRNGSTQTVSGNIRLFAPTQNAVAAGEYEQLNLNYGSRIRIACNPEREESFLNPGTHSKLESLDLQDIDATATVKSPLLVEKLGDESAFRPLAFVYDWRELLIRQFRDKFSVSTAGVMIASLLGDKYFLDKQTAEVFREGGTFHILVISGLHITFIGGLTIFLVRLFTKNRTIQFVVACSFLWAYTLAVGAEVPVVRASLMFTVLLFSRIIHRDGMLLNALGACGLILLAWRPQDLFSPSFQLTFASITAIVVMAFPLIEKSRSIGQWFPTSETPFPPDVPVWLKRLCETLYWRDAIWTIEGNRQIWSALLFKSPYLRLFKAGSLQSILAFLFEGILVSLVVQIWLLPFLVIYFHRISMAAVILNLWVGIVIALESFAALFAVALASASDSLASPFIRLTETLNWLLIAVPQIFADNAWASRRVPVYSGMLQLVYVFYLAPVLFLGYAAYSWKPFTTACHSGRYLTHAVYFAGFAAVILGLIIAFHPFSSPRADGRLHIDFLDVGQGDSALITFPNGETMLIDGGGKPGFRNDKAAGDSESLVFEPDIPTIGEAVVSEFLWEKGYSNIDYLLATHADADHIEGLSAAAKNFGVRKAYFARTPANDEEFAAVYSVLQRCDIEIERIGRGDELMFGGVRIEVIYPIFNDGPNQESGNDQSVVFRLTFGEKRFLFTGDIEGDAERELLETSEFLRADVIKVAHHGSRTSSSQAFVDAASADFAIVSVGRRSMFGHPHNEVVERWTRSGAKVMTTGERGTISIITDGLELDIKTFGP